MKKIILASLLTLLIIAGCSNKQAEYQLDSDQVIEKIENNEAFILYIGSETCGACQIFSPVYQEVRDDYPGFLFMLDYAEELERDNEALEKLLINYTGPINATPSVLVIADGEVKQTFLGIMKYSELENALKNYNMVK